MEREILFRGKRIDNGEWVYGGISVFKGCVDIFDQNVIDNSCEQVFDYTVGQFTGLNDKNGINIFEGDICTSNELNFPFAIKWSKDAFAFLAYKGIEEVPFSWFSQVNITDLTVIGNTTDNPELLNQ